VLGGWRVSGLSGIAASAPPDGSRPVAAGEARTSVPGAEAPPLAATAGAAPAARKIVANVATGHPEDLGEFAIELWGCVAYGVS
jgi:hypothetical protein